MCFTGLVNVLNKPALCLLVILFRSVTVLQIEQYAVNFVQHQMDPPYALNTTDTEQVLNVFDS